jgi:hypothetical protein
LCRIGIDENYVHLIQPSDSEGQTRITEVDLTNGRAVWTYENPGVIYSPPVPLAGEVYVTVGFRDFLVLARNTGKKSRNFVLHGLEQ